MVATKAERMVFISDPAIVLRPDQAFPESLVTQIKQLGASLVSVRQQLEPYKHLIGPTTLEQNELWQLIQNYTPTECRHVPRMPHPAQGVPSPIANVFTYIEGTPRCILCSKELNYCPRCCKGEFSEQKYFRYDLWRGQQARDIGQECGFIVSDYEVLMVQECRFCDLALVWAKEDPEAGIL